MADSRPFDKSCLSAENRGGSAAGPVDREVKAVAIDFPCRFGKGLLFRSRQVTVSGPWGEIVIVAIITVYDGPSCHQCELNMQVPLMLVISYAIRSIS
jgi:hypothetical protein